MKFNRVIFLVFFVSGLSISRAEDKKQAPTKSSLPERSIETGNYSVGRHIGNKSFYRWSLDPFPIGGVSGKSEATITFGGDNRAGSSQPSAKPRSGEYQPQRGAGLGQGSGQIGGGSGVPVVNGSSLLGIGNKGTRNSDQYQSIPVQAWNNHVNPLARAQSDLSLYRNIPIYVSPNQTEVEVQQLIGPKKHFVSPDSLQDWMVKSPEQRRVEYENNKKLLLDQVSSEILKDRNQNKALESQIEKRLKVAERPPGVTQEVSDAPYRAFKESLGKDDYHELVENLKVWQQEIAALKGYKPKAELAKHWENRLQKDFVHENGLLKVFQNAKDYKINLQTEKGREASTFINHLLLVKTELEAAASYQFLTSKADFQEIENYNLSIERERYLKYLERFTKELLSWSQNSDNKINTDDLESIIQDHVAFAESLHTSDDQVSVQVANFLESQKSKSYSSLTDNLVKESSPFGDLGRSEDPVTRAGYEELSDIIRLEENQKIETPNRLDRLSEKDFQRAQEGIFFIPKDSSQGKDLASGLDLLAKSTALFNESSRKLPVDEKEKFVKDYQNLSRSLTEAHILADKLWVSDQSRAAMLLNQIKPIGEFTYGMALGFGHGLKETVYGVKDLVVLTGAAMQVVASSVKSSLKKAPELTLHDAEVALGNFFSGDHLSQMASNVSSSTIAAYQHVSSFIKRIAEESADTLVNGTAKEKGEIVGRVAYEIGFFIFGGEFIKAGVGGAKAVGNTASLIGGAAQKSFEYLAFESKFAQMAKIQKVGSTVASKITTFAKQYPSLVANLIREGATASAIAEVAELSVNQPNLIKKIATRHEVLDAVGMEMQKFLDAVHALDPEAKIGIRGSLPRGLKGIHKLGPNGEQLLFDASSFDVDAFIVSDKMIDEVNKAGKLTSEKWINQTSIPGSRIQAVESLEIEIDKTLRSNPKLYGLRNEKFNFIIRSSKNAEGLLTKEGWAVKPGVSDKKFVGEVQYFFIKN